MSYTKRQFIQLAFANLGYNKADFTGSLITKTKESLIEDAFANLGYNKADFTGSLITKTKESLIEDAFSNLGYNIGSFSGGTITHTKQEIILLAYSAMGYINDEYSLQTSQLNNALILLDAMLSNWQSDGIYLNYTYSSPSSLSDNLVLPDIALEPVYKHLAIKIAPTIGKQLSEVFILDANGALEKLTKRNKVPNNNEMLIGLGKLDAMLSNWQSDGIYLNYTYSSPSSLSDSISLPDISIDPIIKFLTISLSNHLEKPVSEVFILDANGALEKLTKRNKVPNNNEILIGLEQLDTMMSTWNSKGLRLSYPIPSSPEDSNLDDETTVPDAANEAIYLNLAVKLAPQLNIQVLPDVKINARRAYRDLLSFNAYPLEERQLDNTVRGAGAKVRQGYNSPFINPEDAYIEVGSDGDLDLG